MRSQLKEEIPIIKHKDRRLCRPCSSVVYAVWHNADANRLLLCNHREEQQEWTSWPWHLSHIAHIAHISIRLDLCVWTLRSQPVLLMQRTRRSLFCVRCSGIQGAHLTIFYASSVSKLYSANVWLILSLVNTVWWCYCCVYLSPSWNMHCLTTGA